MNERIAENFLENHNEITRKLDRITFQISSGN